MLEDKNKFLHKITVVELSEPFGLLDNKPLKFEEIDFTNLFALCIHYGNAK